MKKFAASVILSCFLLLTSPVHASLVSEGRELLFNNGNPTYAGIVAANEKFRAAVMEDALSQTANFFFAVTQIPASFLTDDANSQTINTVRALLESFGCTQNEGAEFLENPYSLPMHGDYTVLPDHAPGGEALRQFLTGPFITTIDGAIANLDRLNSTFQIFFTASETGVDGTIEVDYGDVLLYKSALQFLKSALLFIGAYNMDVDSQDLASCFNADIFTLQRDVIDSYPDFLKLLPTIGITVDGPALLQQARTAFITAIDTYMAASESIRSEGDSQLDDLIVLELEDYQSEGHFRATLAEVKASLLQGRISAIESTDGTHIDYIDLNHLFGNNDIDPLVIRNILPSFNAHNTIIAETFPDPTMDGIFADFTTEAELVAFTKSKLNVSIQYPLCSGTMIMDGSANDWSAIPAMYAAYFSRSYGNHAIEYVKVARDGDYFYWMIRFLNAAPADCSYSFGLNSGEGYYTSASLTNTGSYTAWASTSQQSYSGTIMDYGRGEIIEGRIPIGFLPLGAKDVSIYVNISNWAIGYYSYLGESSILNIANASMHGGITCASWTGGPIFIQAGWGPHYVMGGTVIDAPGDFHIDGLTLGSACILSAFWDKDGDGIKEPGDYSGSVGPHTVTDINTYIPNVFLDTLAARSLQKISGDLQSAPAGTLLAEPLVVRVTDEAGTGIDDLEVVFSVVEGGGQLSQVAAITNVTGYAQTWLTLGSEPGQNRVTATVSGVDIPATFSATANEALAIITATVPGGYVGNYYTQTMEAQGGTTPYVWSLADSSLPPGLNLNSSTGLINGTPTVAGTYSFTVQVTDQEATTVIKNFSITVLPTRKISGYIKTGVTGVVSPVVGATVRLSGTAYQAVTNINGYFEIFAPDGSYTAVVTASDFADYTVALSISADVTLPDIQMEVQPVQRWDVNGDGKIGLAEVIYIFQLMIKVRESETTTTAETTAASTTSSVWTTTSSTTTTTREP